MARKLVLALALVAAVAVVTGCKDDKPTPMNVADTKSMYQQNQQKYKQSGGTAGATTETTP